MEPEYCFRFFPYVFSFGSENDYDLINAKLREISQKYGEQIDVFRISSIVGYIKSDADRNTAYLKEAAIIAGACAMYYLLHIFYGDNMPANTLVSEIYVKYCISSGIAAGLLTVIISSAIPCALICRVSSVNLMKGRLVG